MVSLTNPFRPFKRTDSKTLLRFMVVSRGTQYDPLYFKTLGGKSH
jgi:hypothetical protein